MIDQPKSKCCSDCWPMTAMFGCQNSNCSCHRESAHNSPEVERRFDEILDEAKKHRMHSFKNDLAGEWVIFESRYIGILKHFLATEIDRAKTQVERDSEKTRPTEQGNVNTPTLEEDAGDKLLVIIDAWVKRLVDLGEIDQHKKTKGGWTLFVCKEAKTFFESELARAVREAAGSVLIDWQWAISNSRVYRNDESTIYLNVNQMDDYLKEAKLKYLPHPKGAEHE